MDKYDITIRIEVDEPLTSRNALNIIKENLKNDLYEKEVIAIELVTDEPEKTI